MKITEVLPGFLVKKYRVLVSFKKCKTLQPLKSQGSMAESPGFEPGALDGHGISSAARSTTLTTLQKTPLQYS